MAEHTRAQVLERIQQLFDCGDHGFVPEVNKRDAAILRAYADLLGKQPSIDSDFRGEVKDKFGVVFHGSSDLPLERDIARNQCEAFIVELHESALAAKEAEIARLTAENTSANEAFARLAARLTMTCGDLVDTRTAWQQTAEVSRKNFDALADERRKVREIYKMIVEAECDWSPINNVAATALNTIRRRMDDLALGREPAPATPEGETT